jgi:histidyl-tRNA synthetase
MFHRPSAIDHRHRFMKPSIPQGTRDFNAATVRKRQYIFNTIRSVFELYGFEPLETPAMENLETLMGKYGEEGDKLIFKILNNGLDNESKHAQAKADFEKVLQGKSTKGLTERALKYDLTIPFARYVAMHHGTLTFPFKRYQIQPVWRADRPQRGRYREFYQCDADVVGSKGLMNEVELVCIYDAVFKKLGLNDYELKINSRKILMALAQSCGGEEKMMDITMAIDKLDKIGLPKVKEELLQRGLTNAQILVIEKYLLIDGSNAAKMLAIENLLGENAKEGVAEINFVLHQKTNANLSVDFTLARGLNYYTGIIFEAKGPSSVQMGSIGGGGRYDDLTSLFGVPNVPGVGISFGVDRMYDVMEELNLFPAEVQGGTKVLFFHLGEAEATQSFELMQQLRSKGVACELYHENAKMDKQFKYAEKKNIAYAVILGAEELQKGNVKVKNLAAKTQVELGFEALRDFVFE